jgi:hypothetical protein
MNEVLDRFGTVTEAARVMNPETFAQDQQKAA